MEEKGLKKTKTQKQEQDTSHLKERLDNVV